MVTLTGSRGGEGCTIAKVTLNEFHVDSVFALSAEETSVTGHVVRGAFRTGESVSLTSASGIPLLAPIVRIGSAETPVSVVREGQRIPLVLHVEPQHVVVGSRLTSKGEDDAYGATMIVDSESEGRSSETAQGLSAELQAIEKLVNNREFHDAHSRLRTYLEANPNDYAAHWLLGRVHLEGDQDLQDNKKALDYIKKAYEEGGADDSAVLETLAYALGANGEVEHGLRFLERRYAMAGDLDSKKYYEERIIAYRKRFNAPDMWEFLDGFGETLLQSSDIDEIARAIENGSIPENAKCRKNKVGELLAIKDSIAKEHPQIAVLFKSSRAPQYFNLAIGAGAGAALGIILSIVGGVSPVLGVLGGTVIGLGIAAGITMTRSGM